MPALQYEVWDGSSVVARLDGAYPELKVAIEVDGYRYHGHREAQSQDRRRRNRLVELGWVFHQVDADHIRDTPALFTGGLLRWCQERAKLFGLGPWPPD
jgi:very-short-patch-repair endonuclease